jgi:NitT/TauT family transport system substrate-binding protein
MVHRVEVGLVSPAVVFLPLWFASETGAFAARGIEVHSQIVGTTDGTTAALVQGQVDVAFGTPDPALSDPGVVSILAGLVDRPPLSMVAQPRFSTFDDLRGCGIGTSSLSEGTVHLITAMMSAHGLALDADYHLVLAGAHPQRWEALQRGTLEAALQLMPYDIFAADAGFAILGRAEDYVPEFAFSSVTVRTGWLSDQPDVAASFKAALVEAEEGMRNEPLLAAQIAARHTRLPEDLAFRCVDRLVNGGVMPGGLRHSERAIAEAALAITGT